MGLRDVLEACVSIGARLVYPSSWEVFSGYRAERLIASTRLPVFPRGPYGEAKALAEQMITWFVSNSGLKATVLRLSPVYGPRLDRPKFIRNFITKAMHDQTIATHIYENGEPKLGLLHIDDAITGIRASLDSGADGVVHLGGESLVGTSEIATFIVRQLASRSRIETFKVADEWANVLLENELTTAQTNWRPTINWESGIGDMLHPLREGHGA